MASYEVAAYYVVLHSADNVYTIRSNYVRYGENTITITNGSESGSFSIGENAKVTYSNGVVREPNEIVAFVSDGIIMQGLYGLYFYTNNASYAGRDQLVTNTNPFPVCFAMGTLIETVRGAVAIESLAVGEQVLGSHGWGTVKWVGWRHYDVALLRSPEQRTACMPVRILAGALGENLPSQDLRVSPWHHVSIDGVLVRANDLINGKSIVQETNTKSFSYYHVELEQFDVIRAYGVYSESYADGGNRDFFQNVDVTMLRPEDKKRRLANRPGFTVLRKADDIAVIRERLAARADQWFAQLAIKAG